MEIVIIGCTHAGTAAAQAILASHPTHHVTIFERHDDISFLACGVALYLGGTVDALTQLHYQTPQALRKLGAQVWLHHNVLKIDVKAHTVVARDMQTHVERIVHYDKLIMATGARHVLPPLTGADAKRVLLCKDAKEAQVVKNSAESAVDIALIGGGYVGVELAEAYAHTGHKVTIFESGAQLLRNYLDAENALIVTKRLRDNGVSVHLNTPVRAFFDVPDHVGLRTRAGEFSFDLAVATTGFAPATTLVENQLTCDRHGALVVNEFGQTSDVDVFAAGDCRTSLFNPTGKPAYIPLASSALRQGALAGLNACGEARIDAGTQATSAMLLFNLCVASTGLTQAAASRVVGLRPHSITWQGPWRPAFMPDTSQLTITLVYDRLSRRLLGAQLLSTHEVAQSANALSIAIQNNNTIDDLAVVDMLFSPHFNEPNNYLNQAAAMAVAHEREAGFKTPKFVALGARGRHL
ncbi:FAD-dependent oxidoreductase [Lacticaseibacillus sp. N501-2]|uniref:FAD-dependent oxidoreductase n=1 Tax=Lacticaseibacillus salsurae TaxID=3367729 RepID=UPI0038B2C439